MLRAGLCVAFVFAVTAGCGSSGGGGAGGSAGGSAGAGGNAGAGGGAAGAGGGNAGAGGGNAGAGGGNAGAGGSAGAGGGAAGAGGTGPVACGTDIGTGSGAACSTVTPSGACVTSVRSNAAAPTPAGGTFVVGTYNLTSRTLYGPSDAAFSSQIGRETFVVLSSSPTSLTIDEAQSSGTRIARAHGTVAISGMTATFTPSCPAADAGSGQGGTVEFTATNINFTLFEQQNGLIQMSVYVRAAL